MRIRGQPFLWASSSLCQVPGIAVELILGRGKDPRSRTRRQNRYIDKLLIQMNNQSESNTEASISPVAVRALMKGQKIEAIKIVREERDVELVEAKEVVEGYIRSDPVIQAELKNVQRNRCGFGWIVLLLALGVLAWFVLAD